MQQEQIPIKNLKINQIILIQRIFRGFYSRKLTHKFVKQLNHRKYVVKELMDTQENYIRDLGIVISDFQVKLINEQIITNAEVQIIFSNVDQIRKLNQDFYIGIYNNYEHYTHYGCIFKDVHKKISFFKIYFEFFNNFTKSSSLLQSLRKKNKKFRQFLEEKERNKKYNLLRLQDYIIKPVQRLPKYVIIFKQLKKRTPHQHSDFKNICQLLSAFEKVNNSTNQKLNKVLNQYKLAEIEQLLGLQDVSQPGVQFTAEQIVTVLTTQHKTIGATMYLLTNQIILKKQRCNVLITRVIITYGASILQDEDNTFYKNILTIQNHEGDGFTLLCQSIQQKQNLFSKLSFLIYSAQKNSMEKLLQMCKKKSYEDSFLKKMTLLQLMPEVTILGTAQRQAKLLKYTIYIIEVKIKMIRQKIFLRFSQLLQVQKLIKQEFPDCYLKQNLYQTTWLLNHKPKTIQQRKMNIQRFLKQVLSKQQVIEGGQLILYKLGLPIDFYQLPAKYNKISDIHRTSVVSQKSIKSPTKRSRFFKKPSHNRSSNRISVFIDSSQEEQYPISNTSKTSQAMNLNMNQLLKAGQVNLGHYTRFSEVCDRSCIKPPKVQLNVYIPCLQSAGGFKKYLIKMQGYLRVQVMISKVAELIQLNYFKDFRLFLQRQYYQRALDDDQILYKIAQQIALGDFKLTFKKMIYIDHQIQIREMKKDPIRLKIIASEIIYNVCKGRYLLQYKNYIRFAVLVGIIIQNSTKKKLQKLSEITKNIITPKFSTVQSNEDWEKDFKKIYQTLSTKLKKIQTQNLQYVRTTMIQRQDDLVELSSLAHFCIVQEIQANPLYGSYLYVTQLEEEFYISLKKQNKLQEMHRNVWLAVKSEEIHLISLCLQMTHYKFKYDDILRTEPFPNLINIILRNNFQIKLKTTRSFEIRQLIHYYKNYQNVWNKIIRDPVFHDSLLQTFKDRQMEEEYVQS